MIVYMLYDLKSGSLGYSRFQTPGLRDARWTICEGPKDLRGVGGWQEHPLTDLPVIASAWEIFGGRGDASTRVVRLSRASATEAKSTSTNMSSLAVVTKICLSFIT